MNLFNNISLGLSGNLPLFILGLLILLAYTFYVYRTTLPPISKMAKGLLMLLRILALSILLFLILDPILKISYSEKIEPKTLFFVDNSKSISEFNSTDKIISTKNWLNDINENIPLNIDFFTFGSSVKKINNLSDEEVNFNAASTEFDSILDEIKKTDNIASVIILSDGIFNEGNNPTNELNNLGIPVYTIGIGDTSTYQDFIIERINANKFIYADRETEVEVIVRNENIKEGRFDIQLFDNDLPLQNKSIEIAGNEISRVRFLYTAKIEGEHKLTAKVTSKISEKNKSNNEQSRIINVLASKKKILVLAGGPSPDLSSLLKNIEKNDEFEISKIIEVKTNSFYKNQKDLTIINESDVIFLVGYPSSNSDLDFEKKAGQIINESNKNIFLATTNTIDFTKIRSIKLPFEYEDLSNEYKEILVNANNSNGNLLGNSLEATSRWNNLPPIFVSKTKIIPSISSEILLSDKSNSIPVLFRSNDGIRKSIVLNASNFWRWNIRSAEDYPIFDNFILNAIKWLSIEGEKQFFNVELPKNNFRLGEKIIFTANLYDETFEPINGQEIVLSLSTDKNKFEYSFSQIADGVYEAEIFLDEPGNYNYVVKLVKNPRQLKPISGSINIDPIELELLDRKLNSRLLESIAYATGGKFFTIDDTEFLKSEINKNYKNNFRYKLIDKELRLSNLEVILLIIVLLFSFEWIIRKVLRMI